MSETFMAQKITVFGGTRLPALWKNCHICVLLLLREIIFALWIFSMCISLKHSHDNAIDDDEDVNVEKLNNYNNLCSTNVEQMLLFQVLNISFFFSIHTEKHDDTNYSYIQTDLTRQMRCCLLSKGYETNHMSQTNCFCTFFYIYL